MDVNRITPPRPFDVAAIFPQLAPLARTATRLHPRPGAPSPRDSSVGGPLLWPAGEPWPHCDGPHELYGQDPAKFLADVRVTRRIRAAARGRTMTPQERGTLARMRRPKKYGWPGPHPYEGSIPMLPLAQLYARDVPDLCTPAGTDLLQVLWCPFDHPPMTFMPRTALFWRSQAAVTDILTAPPEPSEVQSDLYVPEPCLLAPEQITEYPNPMELTKELREPLSDWSRWQEAGAAADPEYEPYPEEFYGHNLSVAPGWKVGGWASWGYTDPVPQSCPACNTTMNPLLTIPTYEWDHGTRSWTADEGRREDQAHTRSSTTPALPETQALDETPTRPPIAHISPEKQALLDFARAHGYEVRDFGRVPAEVRVPDRGCVPAEVRAAPPVTDPVPREPTGIQIGSGHRQQLYICPTSPEHPHTELMQ